MIYFVLNGIVSAESKIKRFNFPKVFACLRLDMLRDRYEKIPPSSLRIRAGIVSIGAHIGVYQAFAKYTGRRSCVRFWPDNQLLFKRYQTS